ncbi:hypothetical protein DENSPDRAFT_873244 [Dentipellis sp. KUC8613]|nr:hypothetical protein DENSPDRAFT_873244 [Dentipellis sp. KUC8613]
MSQRRLWIVAVDGRRNGVVAATAGEAVLRGGRWSTGHGELQALQDAALAASAIMRCQSIYILACISTSRSQNVCDRIQLLPAAPRWLAPRAAPGRRAAAPRKQVSRLPILRCRRTSKTSVAVAVVGSPPSKGSGVVKWRIAPIFTPITLATGGDLSLLGLRLQARLPHPCAQAPGPRPRPPIAHAAWGYVPWPDLRRRGTRNVKWGGAVRLHTAHRIPYRAYGKEGSQSEMHGSYGRALISGISIVGLPNLSACGSTVQTRRASEQQRNVSRARGTTEGVGCRTSGVECARRGAAG